VSAFTGGSERRHLVAVRWRDAHGSSLSEFAEHEIPHHAYIWTTYGLLMRDDDEGISIASEVSEGSYRGVTFVPRQMIIEVVDLGVPHKPRQRKSKGARPAPSAAPASASAEQPTSTSKG
jgi:hypothetical protein